MGSPYLGEIRMFAGAFAPAGWAVCSGQLLAISENDALFSLIGTTYGGDGETTFQLPDLQGRVPIHFGQGPGLSARVLGETGGTEQVTLTQAQIPMHNHVLVAAAVPAQAAAGPVGSTTAIASTPLYGTSHAQLVEMSPDAVGPVGGSQPHDNVAPFQCVTFIISLEGIYPPQA
jgi:microcystin-dependent protein